MFVNNATLTYTVSFVDGADVTGRIDTASHAGQIYSYFQGYPEPDGHRGLTGLQHEQDGEKIALNTFANRLYAHLGCTDEQDFLAKIRSVRTGVLRLQSTIPCSSQGIPAFRPGGIAILDPEPRSGGVLCGSGVTVRRAAAGSRCTP
ncbi:hypothetical protein C7C46_30855 [Streptomyces tateyamensis]|uniref:Uncharacterized protein n=2 Tax=Streptomyces tateyamensis TaxID=565073 RepID=A0A2V4N0G9_9ACTN|nr:hypothetical protein C7C46_30855 [Streptomyces tateyamensis]